MVDDGAPLFSIWRDELRGEIICQPDPTLSFVPGRDSICYGDGTWVLREGAWLVSYDLRVVLLIRVS